ncbi:MAG: hypothetical protein IID43_07195, partial [Planctomycetes bacterium]|nr:hypothetical protein [Planctomycetota bacterium]
MNAQQHAGQVRLQIEGRGLSIGNSPSSILHARSSIGNRQSAILNRPLSLCHGLLAIMFVSIGAATALANAELGRVTLIAGAPRMVGESIRPLQAVFSGRMLETGEDDAAGLLIQDIVFHIGPNSRVTLFDEPGVKRIVLERGFVVFYTEPQTRTEVVVETPFGRLTSSPESWEAAGSGWYSVRHDPERINVSPAVSTFAAMEGPAEKGVAIVLGTVPEAGPYKLQPGQRWRIVQGEIPGPPEAGDERAAAEALAQMLHREAAETIHAQSVDLAPLTTVDLGGVLSHPPGDLLEFEGQF